MSPKQKSAGRQQIEHTIRILARPTMPNADHLRRLNRAAHRDPTAVLGVLEFWLGPEPFESAPRGNC
jgi:hypothetical protein